MASGFEDSIKNQRCFLCRRGAKLAYGNDGYFVECKTCGEFHIGRTMLATISEGEMDFLPYLSIYTRQASDRREKILLNSENWKEIALACKQTPVSVKASKLLELIGARSKPGHPVKFDPHSDPPLVDASDPNELGFLLRHLKEIGNLEATNDGWTYILKAKGWQELQSAKTQGGVPGKCFVAMSFHESLKEPYEQGIYLALKSDCKMEPVRIDLVPHNDNIVDKIIAEIRTCQFMVADFTGQKGGVYFEAGFAKGLGRPVIWTCREDDFENVHFDIAQFSHIKWKDAGDLRTRLADKIKATIPGAA